MEGVGARLGRSSRYGPATVFTGPVRKWKKNWVHVSPSNNNNKDTTTTTTNHSHNAINGHSHTSNGSHLLFYKWTPLAPSPNTTNGVDDNSADAATPPPDDRPKKKFKYVPIAVLEEQKREAEDEATENVENEAKESEGNLGVGVTPSKNDGYDEKLDINDIPMEESQEDKRVIQQDLNESTLDLSLG